MTQQDPLEEARRLVERLGVPADREAVSQRLSDLGPAARDAVFDGLGHANWQVRRWCALYFDRHPDAEALEAMKPLLRDPKSQVRLFALHSLACDRCKEDCVSTPSGVVPLLIERIQQDESIRVRRHAVAMLGYQHAHPDLEGFFKHLLDTETDRKLHMHAGFGWMRCREAAGKDPLGGDD